MTVQVVFSEPVDSSSVTTEAITLTRVRDGVPVTGSAMRSPGTPLQAEWQPSGSLEPGTEYRLEVRRVRDLSGDSLQTPVFVSFTTGSALAPVPLQNVMKVAAGYDHSCALDSAGLAYCWGEGLWGQLGRGTRDLDAFAEPVVAESSFGEVVLGESFSCGLTAGGVAMCWGLNWFGQLGLSQQAAAVCSHPNSGSALACSLAPVVVQSNVQFRSLTAGAAHVCGLTFDGRAYCWGDNVSGQMGADDTGERCDQYYTRQLSCSSTPVLVQGGFSFNALEAGGYHTCGLTSDGSAYCWGQNLDGELGTGDTIGGAVPRPVAAGGRRFFTISAGRWHTCGVADDGRTYCWGWNGDGQLGVGDFEPRSLPSPIFSVTDRFGSVRGGGFWTTALRADGALYVWGRQSVVAFNHLPGATFSFVVPGRDHVCLGGSGEAYCFGSNFHGQLGNGQVLGSFTWTPQRVLTRP